MAEDATPTRKRSSRRRVSADSHAVSLEDFAPTEQALLTIVADRKKCPIKDVMRDGIRYFLNSNVKVDIQPIDLRS